MESCSYCLGCIGLKNKSFYILNKQYTKEERYEKANEIFEQMDKE
jgi:pentatricopeptide repeat protein